MQFVEITSHTKDLISQAAALLQSEFKTMAPEAWPTLESALHEVNECVDPERICFAALNNNNELLGWIGGIPHYPNAWELHPLVVNSKYAGKGIGSALIQKLELNLRKRDVLTLYVGTDDIGGMTSLADKDLYAHLFDELKNIKNIKGHPFEFYQKNGFQVVGVIPDANGRGKPDIYMAKRIG